MSKKIYTYEDLDRAIDRALKIGDHELAKLYAKKDYIESEIKRKKLELKDLIKLIEDKETERNNYEQLHGE